MKRRLKELRGCSCAAGADFQHRGSNERDGADEDGNRDGNVFVGVGHVDLATSNDAIKYGSDDTQEQAGAHASGDEEQRGKEHAERGCESDREPGTTGWHGCRVGHLNILALCGCRRPLG